MNRLPSNAAMRPHLHEMSAFRLTKCVGSDSRPLTHRAVRRGCSVVSHTIVFEYVRLSRTGMTRHIPFGSEADYGKLLRFRCGLSRRQASLASALPPCAAVRATAPLVFLHLGFSPKKAPCRKPLRPLKTPVFRCPDHAGAISTP